MTDASTRRGRKDETKTRRRRRRRGALFSSFNSSSSLFPELLFCLLFILFAIFIFSSSEASKALGQKGGKRGQKKIKNTRKGLTADSGFFLSSSSSSSLSYRRLCAQSSELSFLSFARACSCFMRVDVRRVVISSIGLFFFFFFPSSHMRTFECVFFLVCVRASMCAYALRVINFSEHTFAHSNVFSLSLYLFLYIIARTQEK